MYMYMYTCSILDFNNLLNNLLELQLAMYSLPKSIVFSGHIHVGMDKETCSHIWDSLLSLTATSERSNREKNCKLGCGAW